VKAEGVPIQCCADADAWRWQYVRGAAEKANISAPEFVERVKGAARAIDTMDVRYDYEERALDDGELLKEGNRRLISERGKGRGRWEETGVFKPTRPDVRHIAVGPKGFASVAQAFNGKLGTRMTGGGPAARQEFFHSGDVRESAHAVVRDLISDEPAMVPGYYGFTPRTFTDAGWDRIARADGVSVERVVEDGHDCFLLSFPWGTVPSVLGQRIWFDAQRGFARACRADRRGLCSCPCGRIHVAVGETRQASSPNQLKGGAMSRPHKYAVCLLVCGLVVGCLPFLRHARTAATATS